MPFQIWMPSGVRPYENDSSVWINPTTGEKGTHNDKAMYEIGLKHLATVADIDNVVNQLSVGSLPLDVIGKRADLSTNIESYKNCVKKLGNFTKNICHGYLKSIQHMYKNICDNQSSDEFASLVSGEAFHNATNTLNVLSGGAVMAPLWNHSDDVQSRISNIKNGTDPVFTPEYMKNGNREEVASKFFDVSNKMFDSGLKLCGTQKATVSNIHYGLTDFLLAHRQLRQILDVVNMIENCSNNMLDDLDTISPALAKHDTVLDNVRSGHALAKDSGQDTHSSISNSIANLNIENRMKDGLAKVDFYKQKLLQS